MLPIKIFNFIEFLKNKTDREELKWHYDDEKTTVEARFMHINTIISYHFDMTNEEGVYKISIEDKNENKIFYFTSNQFDEDFETVRSLFDSAQSSDFKFDFDPSM